MDDRELAELSRASDELIVALRRAWIESCEAVVAHELDTCVDRGVPDDEHARLLRERNLAGQRLAQVSGRGSTSTARPVRRRQPARSSRSCGP